MQREIIYLSQFVDLTLVKHLHVGDDGHQVEVYLVSTVSRSLTKLRNYLALLVFRLGHTTIQPGSALVLHGSTSVVIH